jgi:hypothetical protein
MAGFSLVKEPQETEYEKLRIASQAYTIGDAVMLDRTSNAVDVVPATAATTTFGVYAVAMETVASTATEALFCIIDPRQKWVTDSQNNSNSNHRYQRMVLQNKSSVNNTGTDDTTSAAVFMQTQESGAASAKRIVGKFLKVANVTA